MNEGVKILLERIKTNPDEFIYNPSTGMSRWQRLVDHALADEIATEEESKALKDALREAKRDRFTELVMKELLAPEEENDSLGKWFTKPASGTPLGGQTQGVTLSSGAGAGTWGTSSIQLARAQQAQIQHDSTVEHMKAHIEALQVKDRKALLKKPHKTLFGKLFNYS